MKDDTENALMQCASNFCRQLLFAGSITLQYYALWIFCSSKTSPLVIPVATARYNPHIALPSPCTVLRVCLLEPRSPGLPALCCACSAAQNPLLGSQRKPSLILVSC